jgi:hypothetical protein
LLRHVQVNLTSQDTALNPETETGMKPLTTVTTVLVSPTPTNFLIRKIAMAMASGIFVIFASGMATILVSLLTS